jgi:VWFA-related protein
LNTSRHRSANRRPRAQLAVYAAIALIAGFAAAGRWAWAQEPTAPAGDARLFFDTVEVTRVNVDVHVTDRDGNPVLGLTAGDFELFEDGRPVAVTNFYAVAGGRPTEESVIPTAPPAAGEPPPLPRAAPPPPPEDQQLSLVLFFDNLHLRPFNRNQVARHAQQFVLRTLGPHDRAMVVTFERSLNVRQPFTHDSHLLLEALDGMEKLTGLAVQAASERSQVIRRIESSRSANEARDHADFYAKSVYDDAINTIDALKRQVEALAGLPGRKMLLYISDGLPMNAGEDLFVLADNRFSDQGISGQMMATRYKIDRPLRELTALANANRVSFYTLEAEGMRAHSSLAADVSGPSGSYLEIDSVDSSNLRQPLLELAADTGGLATVNTNNFAQAFRRVDNDIDSYYSLAFRPARDAQGRYRKIDVRVNRKGLDVRFRGGYRDKSVETRVRETTLATLLYGSQSNDLGIELLLSAAQPQGNGTYKVPLDVRIPLASITLIEQGDHHRGEVRVAVAVGDEGGGNSAVSQVIIPLSIPTADRPTARTQYYTYTADLLLRPGRQDIAVATRDELAGQSSYLRKSVAVQ